MAFPFRLSRRGVLTLMGILSGGALLLLVGTGLARAPQLLPSWGPAWLRAAIDFAIHQANLSREDVAAVWFSSVLFLGVALAAAACFRLDLTRPSRALRLGSLAWLALCGLALLLSISEMASLHEATGDVGRVPAPSASASDGPGAGVAMVGVLLAALLLWVGWKWLGEHGAAFWLLLAGGLLYLSVPFQERVETDMLRQARAETGRFQRPKLHTWLEEGAELFGSILLLGGLAFYAGSVLRSFVGTGSLGDPSGGRALGRPLAAEPGREGEAKGGWSVSGTLRVPAPRFLAGTVLLVAAFGLGMAGMAGLMEILDQPRESPSLGEPMSWFPSMLVSLAAFACFYGAWAARRLSPNSRALRVSLVLAGLYGLILGMELGADLAFSTDLWEGNPRWQAAVDVAFAAGAVSVAGMLWRGAGAAERVLFCASAVVLASVFLLRPAPSHVLAYLGSSALLLGLSLTWARVGAVATSDLRPDSAAARDPGDSRSP